MLTARRSGLNRRYFLIYLDGRAWRVCHERNLLARWPGISIEGEGGE